MSMLVAEIGISNVGSIERGRISPEITYTIDKVIVKMSNGKRFTRYAVCVNGRWKTNQRMSLREAHETVKQMRDDFITKAGTIVNSVTDNTFKMVDDLASYAGQLEEIGLNHKAEMLRRIAGELENANHSLLGTIKN